MRDPDALAEPAGDELLLVHLKRGTTYRLNATGRLVWEALEAGATAREAADRLSSTFHVPSAQIEEDVAALLDDLLANGLVAARPS